LFFTQLFLNCERNFALRSLRVGGRRKQDLQKPYFLEDYRT